MSRQITPFGLRMPDDMKIQIKTRAETNRRSMNSEIVMILAAALGNQSPATTGQSLPEHPVVASETAALQGGVSHQP